MLCCPEVALEDDREAGERLRDFRVFGTKRFEKSLLFVGCCAALFISKKRCMVVKFSCKYLFVNLVRGHWMVLFFFGDFF